MKKTKKLTPPQRGKAVSRTTLRMWVRLKVNPQIQRLRVKVEKLEAEVKKLKRIKSAA